jgi:hypothetical protein
MNDGKDDTYMLADGHSEGVLWTDVKQDKQPVSGKADEGYLYCLIRGISML